MKIQEFIELPILSEETFNALDKYEMIMLLTLRAYMIFRNHDGFITKGELKLANKDASMSDVMQVKLKLSLITKYLLSFQVIHDYDYDQDGKLNMAEYNQYRSDSSEKSLESRKSIEHTSDSDEVVMVNLKQSGQATSLLSCHSIQEFKNSLISYSKRMKSRLNM